MHIFTFIKLELISLSVCETLLQRLQISVSVSQQYFLGCLRANSETRHGAEQDLEVHMTVLLKKDP